jgi:hypothetical protein
MGKRRVQVQRTRKQTRQIKPKLPAAPTGEAAQKKQREKYVAAGGFLQGYAPEFVLRLGYAAVAVSVVCVLVMIALLLNPLVHSMPLRIVAALAWLVPIAFFLSFVAPGVRLAWSDRKKEPRLVQGQLLGASNVSTSLGLGMIMVKTRGGTEQLLCPPERLAKVPGNVVNVALTVTPGLKHVRNVSVMGQRMMGRPEQPVPPVLKRLRLLPLLTPAALAAAVIVGDDATALAPIPNDLLHIVLAVVVAALLGGAVYGISVLTQRRLMAEVQALVPGGFG